MVFFNLIGLAMPVVSGLIAAAAEQSGIFEKGSSLFIVTSGAFTIDLLYRNVFLRPRLDPQLQHRLTTYLKASFTRLERSLPT